MASSNLNDHEDDKFHIELAQASEYYPPGPDWFSKLFGFSETGYRSTQKLFAVRGTRLYSRANGQSWEIGTFETPSLAQLRQRVAQLPPPSGGPLKLSVILGDVITLQALASNRLALFQAASQFNCLEFVGPSVVPEDGIAAYVCDRTQGPACSVSAGPATVFRNYFAPVQISKPTLETSREPSGSEEKSGSEEQLEAKPQWQIGQTSSRMLNNLDLLNERLGNVPEGRFFQVKGGYTLARDDGLVNLNRRLAECSREELAQIRDCLKVGVHSDVQVTSTAWGSVLLEDSQQRISQVFGSACSISYSRNPRALWRPFASLILDASYEATLYAAVLNMAKHQGEGASHVVYLTLLGGGVFGNELKDIASAIEKACVKLSQYPLDVRIVCRFEIENEVQQIVNDYNQ